MGDGTQQVGVGSTAQRPRSAETTRPTGERGRRPAAAPTSQTARRRLMRTVTADVPAPRVDAEAAGVDRAARREALLHVLEMTRRRREHGRR